MHLTQNMTEKEKRIMKEIFVKYDSDQDGKFSKMELSYLISQSK